MRLSFADRRSAPYSQLQRIQIKGSKNMLTRISQTAALLTVISIAAGCASTPQQSLDANTNLSSKAIAVVPVGMPKNAQVTVIHSAGASFGLIGGLADAARFSAHAKDLAEMLQNQGYNFHSSISEGIVGVVRVDGYQAIVLDEGKTGSERSKWLTPLPADKSADLYLDVYLDTFGYVADNDSTPYFPAIAAQARVTDLAGKQIFYSHVIYNPVLDVLGNSKGPKLPVDSQYGFANMDALKADPKKAREGLEAAVSALLLELKNELNQTQGKSTVALAH
jgi:hypothetical protein